MKTNMQRNKYMELNLIQETQSVFYSFWDWLIDFANMSFKEYSPAREVFFFFNIKMYISELLIDSWCIALVNCRMYM